MNTIDRIVLLLTGLVALYLVWRFYTRYAKEKKLYDIYYMMGFIVLLVSGLLLIFLGYGILASPWVLTVASLIPLGISMGIMNQYFQKYKKIYAWFALIGILAIALTSINGSELKKNGSAAFPWCGRFDHFPRSHYCQRSRKSAERILVGGHRWSINWSWRNCPGVPLGWNAILVLQPGVRSHHFGALIVFDELCVCLGICKRYPRKVIIISSLKTSGLPSAKI